MMVTGVERCKKAKGRVNVMIDGDFAFSCYVQTAVDEGLRPGRTLTAEEADRIRKTDGDEFAWRAACRYIDTGMRTELQVRRSLARRGVDEGCIERTVRKLIEYRMVDDLEYAQLLADELYRKYGRWVIRRKLHERGIDDRTAEAVTTRPCDYHVLEELAARYWDRSAGQPETIRRQKVLRSLASKGFDFDDIRQALDACAARGTSSEGDT